MRLRTWLDSLAHRHASTRSPKKRRSHGPKATTRKTHAAYQSLASETLEPRQLLKATSGSTELEDIDFTQAVQLTDPSSESGENSSDTSGSLAGFKWHDANGNGAWDSGEVGLADWTIYIDANENGALDSGEASTTTAADGSYRFDGLAPDNYTIGEVQQEGWQQTYPDSLGNAAGSSVDTSNLSTPEILVGAAYTDGELIVKLRDEASAPGVLSDLRSLQKTIGGTTLRAAEDLGFELWSIEGDVKDAIAQWGDNPSFQYIQPNYTITVDATVPNDTEEGTQLQYVNIILNETNQGPTAVHLRSTLAAVAEDADTSSRTRVAHIEITDDGVGTNTVSLIGADADQFEVVGDSLYLKANRTLDYETQASYSVTVSVQDSSVADSAIGSPVVTDLSLLVDDLDDILDVLAEDWAQSLSDDANDS